MPEDPTTAHPDWHEADPDVYVDLCRTADMRPDFVVPLPLWALSLRPVRMRMNRRVTQCARHIPHQNRLP